MSEPHHSQIFLGRQPILGREQQLLAYELLFRDGPILTANRAEIVDPSQATATVIANAFTELSADETLGPYRGYINVDQEFLFNDLIEALPPKVVVLEILETVRPTPEVIARCRQLCEKGFSLAIDDVVDVDEAYRADWDKFKMWDLVTTNPEATFRAYSMANHPAEGNIIMLNIRIATPPFDKATGGFMKVNPGICSSYIFSRKPGDKVTISGPYGEFFLPDNLPDTQELIFIGGGAGMAPMRSHLMHLFKTEKTKRPVSFWYGARALKEAPYVDEFHAIEKEFPNFKFNLALDRPDPEADAAGVKYTPGFVHNVLYENYLKNHQAPEDCIYLMCGPPMMIASVVKMLDDLGVPSENILYDNFGS